MAGRGIRVNTAGHIGAGEPRQPPHDRFAEGLRGFGPLGILAILVMLAGNYAFVPLSAILVLVWARWSRTPWREIGYVPPKSWIGSLAAVTGRIWMLMFGHAAFDLTALAIINWNLESNVAHLVFK